METRLWFHEADIFYTEETKEKPRETCVNVFPVCRRAAARSTGQGGVMFRFRYKISEKMGTRRDVEPAADAVFSYLRLQ